MNYDNYINFNINITNFKTKYFFNAIIISKIFKLLNNLILNFLLQKELYINVHNFFYTLHY